MNPTLTRRVFLRQSLLATAALAVPAAATAAATSPPAARPESGPSRRVIVVGAGLAGLAAAYELSQAGHEVVVLEARTRAGGRVQTLREPFAEGLYAEAGAMYVHDTHDQTIRFARLCDVALDPLPVPGGAALYHLRGRRIVQAPLHEGGWPLDLSAEDKILGRHALWEKYLDPLLRQVGTGEAPGWPGPEIAAYDGVTFAELLRQRGVTPDTLLLLRLGFPDLLGEGADATSALDVLREGAQRATAREVFTLRGGSDRLPLTLAAKLADRIHYGAPVVRIEHDATAVRAVVAAGGPGGGHRTLSADHLICTVPFSVLRTVEIAPPLAPEKRRAIAELPYTSVSRVYLQTRTRFWEAAGLSGLVLTDLPITAIFEHGSDLSRRGILESYTAGAQARRIAAMAADERLRAVVREGAALLPELPEQFEGGTAKCWDEDPWARGAYAWFRPGQMTALRPHLASREGRLHFAGEHTSTRPGWMQGALASGVRAAREVTG